LLNNRLPNAGLAKTWVRLLIFKENQPVIGVYPAIMPTDKALINMYPILVLGLDA
jgi:hypothetical protein